MADTEVILIRHGETEWNVAKRFQGHKDSDLTENGKQQVEALGTRFQDEDLDQLYSSDLLRTQKTAKPVSLGTGCQVELDVRLREKNLGIFEGLNVPEIQEQHPDAYKAFREGGARYRIESGESTLDHLVRALGFLEEIPQKHEGQKVGIVTHGGFIRVILKNSLGLSQILLPGLRFLTPASTGLSGKKINGSSLPWGMFPISTVSQKRENV